jgi:hypothetical protein
MNSFNPRERVRVWSSAVGLKRSWMPATWRSFSKLHCCRGLPVFAHSTYGLPQSQ